MGPLPVGCGLKEEDVLRRILVRLVGVALGLPARGDDSAWRDVIGGRAGIFDMDWLWNT